MNRLFAGTLAIAACLALSACNTVGVTLGAVTAAITVNGPNPLTIQRQAQVHATYDVFVTAAQHYWNGEDASHHAIPPGLPACRVGTPQPCAKRSVVLALQKASANAGAAVDTMDGWIAAHPNDVGIAGYIDAATRAIAIGQSILN